MSSGQDAVHKEESNAGCCGAELCAAEETGRAPPNTWCTQCQPRPFVRGRIGQPLGPETLIATSCCQPSGHPLTPLCITSNFSQWLPQLSFGFLFLLSGTFFHISHHKSPPQRALLFLYPVGFPFVALRLVIFVCD